MMYAKLPWNIHREAFLAADRGYWGADVAKGTVGKLPIKSLKHEMASTLYTLCCEQVARLEELHVSWN
jgi:hypothetical protein